MGVYAIPSIFPYLEVVDFAQNVTYEKQYGYFALTMRALSICRLGFVSFAFKDTRLF